MRIETETKLDFKDVLIRPKRSTLSSRSDVVLHKTFTLKHSKAQWSVVPLIASNMDTTGTFETAAVMASHDTLTAIHKHYPVDTWEKALAGERLKDHKDKLFITSGIGSEDLKKLYTLTESLGITNMCIDVANGYSEVVVDAIRSLREKYPCATIAAGNVVTGEMTEELLLSGADIVKVGIGPGSVCTTRRVAGVGYPQLSAVVECADAAHGLGGLIISDGGCTCPGDVAKALGAGADFVMLGGMLAGHEESAGELIQNEKGERFKEFYGMSSAVAMQKYSGGVANYRACEGKRVLIPYRGQLNDTMQEILGGLRSACTYVGARYLKELSKRTTFVRVTQQLNPTFNTPSS